MRREGCTPWWSTPARLGGSGVDDGGDAGVLGGYGVVDEMQDITVNSRVWSTCSFMSWSDEEARPERARASVRSSGSWNLQIPGQNGREKCSPSAPEQGKGGGDRRGDAAHRWVPILKKNSAAVLWLQR
jgi:hypothetical protein